MLGRSLLLALTTLALGAPTAGAAVADRFVHLDDVSTGVEAGMGKRTVYLRFGAKAAALYRAFAGRKLDVGCGRPSEPSDDGTGGGGITGDGSVLELRGGGYASTDFRFPRRRGRVNLPFVGDPYDACYIATPERRSDPYCLPVSQFGHANMCVRMVVALTDAGRAMIAARSRLIELGVALGAPSIAELQRTFGDDVVVLANPDAVPPAGTVGVFEAGATHVVAVLGTDGRRLFVRQDADVYSTNVPAFSFGSGAFSLI